MSYKLNHSNNFRAPVAGLFDPNNRMRNSSVASVASTIIRNSQSYTNLSGLIEEPRRQAYPTAVIANGYLRVPMTMDDQNLCHEALTWAKSPNENELSTSARIIKNFNSLGDHTATMLVDEDDKMMARPGDDVLLYLQLTHLDVSGFPSNFELFYTITLKNGFMYQSKVWNVNDKPIRMVEPFLLPFTCSVFVNVYGRFPVVAAPKKKSFLSTLKKKNPRDVLVGRDLKLGSCELHWNKVDFGKETIALTLETDAHLDDAIRLLNPNANLSTITNKHEVELRVGVWTGAVPRLRNIREAAYQGFLTLQSNPKCPSWRRYWAQVIPEEGYLKLYDFEYRTAKLHHTISLDNVTGVRPADQEEHPIPNTFVVLCGSNSYKTTSTLRTGILSDSQIDIWASSDTLVSVEPSMWVCRSDSDNEMNRWMQALAAAARMIRATKTKGGNSK